MADNFTVLDGNGAPRVLRSTDSGGVHTPHQKVELPGTAEADIAAIKGHVDGVEAALTTLTGHVDGLEALGTALNGFVDGIETLIGTTNTALTTLQGYVDGLETLQTTIGGYLDTVETKLQSVIDGQVPAATVYDGNKNVTTAGTRVVLASSQALTKGVRIRAKDANTGLIYVGGTGVSSSSDRLAPGEPIWMDVNNLANVWIDAAVNGEGVTFSAW